MITHTYIYICELNININPINIYIDPYFNNIFSPDKIISESIMKHFVIALFRKRERKRVSR